MLKVARRIVGLLSLLLLSAHCAARHPALTSSQLADVTRAEMLVHEGCYRCLQEAYEIYAGLAGRPSDLAVRGAFDVTLLLAVPDPGARAALSTLADSSVRTNAGGPGSRDPAQSGRGHRR